jgi:hypothetical protein
MTLAKAAAAFAQIAVDSNARPEDRRKARAMLAGMGAVETPAPRIVHVEAPKTAAEIAANVLAENPELRREWVKAQKEAEINARLSPRERELLARLDKADEPPRAYSAGNTRFTPFATRDQAKAILAKLDDEMKGVEGHSRDEEESGREFVDGLVRRGHGDPVGPNRENYEAAIDAVNDRFGVKK